jgi:hypothetical protein
MVAGQKVALGRIDAHTVTVYVADTTLTIEAGDNDTRTVARTTTTPSATSNPSGPARPPNET